MSRVANNPITIPSGIEVILDGKVITLKSSKATLKERIHNAVEIVKEGNMLRIKPRGNIENADAIAGTTRVLLNNNIIGLTKGFEKKLVLMGVGYRAQVQGKKLNLALGFSHPVNYQIPDGINIDTPSQTEITIKGINKNLVGQVAAEIRAFRPPEPYKGKGVRYVDEEIILKEGKKK